MINLPIELHQEIVFQVPEGKAIVNLMCTSTVLYQKTNEAINRVLNVLHRELSKKEPIIHKNILEISKSVKNKIQLTDLLLLKLEILTGPLSFELGKKIPAFLTHSILPKNIEDTMDEITGITDILKVFDCGGYRKAFELANAVLNKTSRSAMILHMESILYESSFDKALCSDFEQAIHRALSTQRFQMRWIALRRIINVFRKTLEKECESRNTLKRLCTVLEPQDEGDLNEKIEELSKVFQNCERWFEAIILITHIRDEIDRSFALDDLFSALLGSEVTAHQLA